jgi:hypothetical protein
MRELLILNFGPLRADFESRATGAIAATANLSFHSRNQQSAS